MDADVRGSGWMRTDADKGGGQNQPIFCGRPLCMTPRSRSNHKKVCSLQAAVCSKTVLDRESDREKPSIKDILGTCSIAMFVFNNSLDTC